MSKNLVTQIRGFDVKMKQSEDLDFIYRLLQETELITINNYHFMYYYGKDNLYAFLDYHNIDIDSIIYNSEMVKRLCRHIMYKIKLDFKMKKMVRSRNYKKYLISLIDKDIYQRMMTYVYISRRVNKIRGTLVMFQALKYRLKYRDIDDKLIIKEFLNLR